MDKKEWQVIIVGGGPAGAIAGYKFAQKNISCIILDKANFPREKPCGGGITIRTIQMFPELKQFMEFANYKQILHYKDNNEEIIIESEDPVAYFNSRKKLDHDLLKFAESQGCVVKEGVKITQIQEDSEKISVISDSGEIFQGDFLIGADGVHSIIRKKIGLQRFWKNNKEATILTSDVLLNKPIIDKLYKEGSVGHLHMGFGDLKGYGWVFPRENYLNIGFGYQNVPKERNTLRPGYENYVKYIQEKNLFPSGDIPKPLGWVLQTGGPIKILSKGRCFLIGDAAGLVHPMTGEGIIYAFWSGALVVDVLNQYYNNKINLKQTHKLYKQLSKKAYTNDLRLIARFQKLAMLQMGLVFKLAQKDEKLYNALRALLPAEIPFKKLVTIILFRIFIGLMRGNLFRKK